MSGPAAWCAALLDPDREVPPGLSTWNGSDPAQRFAVYRNNVTVSLMDALAETFPVCQAMVGAPHFRDLARAFVRRHPPRSPVLARYGHGFADFIAECTLAAPWPYLPDLARLELAWGGRRPCLRYGWGCIHRWPPWARPMRWCRCGRPIRVMGQPRP